jgi:hypothetical protein
LSEADLERRRVRIASVTGLVVGAAAFYSILLDFGTDLGRTALSLPFASNFFELQADAFQKGHLYVPPGSLGIEGFVHDGHTYMYFGPLPALLRLPVMYITHDFDGHMTLVMMGIAFAIYALMLSRLTWQVRRLVLPGRPVTALDATLGGLFIAAATGGTTLTYDASLPWAYHEIYLWQSAILISAASWLIRAAEEPTWVSLRWIGFLAMCAVATRTTGGFGLCVAVLAQAAWFRFRPRTAEHRARAGWLLAAALVALGLGVAYNWAKFDNAYLFPLQDQVWTQVNAHRRAALAANGGHLTGLQFFWTGVVNYFSPEGIRFVGYFPWVTLPAHNARGYGGAFIDQSYRTGSVTAFSPLLLVLALSALPVLVRDRHNRDLRRVLPALLGTFVMTGGVMAYGYVAYRYTTEFLPGLVLFGLIGLWGVWARVAARVHASSRRAVRLARVPLVGVTAVLTGFAILANMSVGFAAAATTYRGAPLARYVSLQDRLSGGPGTTFSRLVGHSDALPAAGETDQLHITGDCSELFLNTGDATQPWIEVAARTHVVTVALASQTHHTRVALWKIRVVGVTRTVWLETGVHHRARVFLSNEGGRYFGPWVSPAPGEKVTVGLGIESDLGYAAVTMTPGGFIGYLPYEAWSPAWVNRPGTITDAFGPRLQVRHAGLVVRRVAGLPSPLCEQIARDNHVSLAP